MLLLLLQPSLSLFPQLFPLQTTDAAVLAISHAAAAVSDIVLAAVPTAER